MLESPLWSVDEPTSAAKEISSDMRAWKPHFALSHEASVEHKPAAEIDAVRNEGLSAITHPVL